MPSFPSGVKVISGLRIAKATVHYSKQERVRDAVLWLRGEAAVAPTFRLAAHVFRVSAPLVVKAYRLVEQLDNKRHGNGNGTTTLSDDVVQRFVIEIGPDRILHALDRVTQPTLPLQAAE
jgi:hypothetical protein